VFPLPGALLGLVGPLHECVPVLVQRRRFGSITQERLASSPASREWPCAAARLALPADSSDAPSRVSNLSPPPNPPRTATLTNPLPAPKGCCYTTATPEARGPSDSGPRAPRESRPVPERRGSIDWEMAIDGCEAGMACRPG
jgi:hypothetical protein